MLRLRPALINRMKIRYVILILVGLFVLSLVADRNNSVFNADRARWIAALNWTAGAIGVAVAAASCIRLLMAAMQGAKLPQVMPSVIAFLAGVTLYSLFWAVPIALAAVVVCWLVVEHFRPSDGKTGDGPN
jgi:cytochrome b561